MRYAYHFSDSGNGWFEYDTMLFRALLQSRSRYHVLVFRGNIGRDAFGKSDDRVIHNVHHIVNTSLSSFTPSQYLELFAHTSVYILLVQGMTHSQADAIRDQLSSRNSFLGMLGLSFNDRLHRAVYGSRFSPSYRVIGDELRLRHDALAVALDDERDHSQIDRWRKTALFKRVLWENIGVRTTILDEFDSPEHDAIVGETENLLSDLLEGVAMEVMLRTIDLDPRLVEALHAALYSLQTARTSEQLAQSALSCRRFLERLADRLFPTSEEERNGRKLGPAQWKNRLWAFAEDAIGSSAASDIDSRLADIGARIDAVARSADSGVHRPEMDQVRATRLITALVSLSYDLALLTPPPTELPGDAYEPSVRRMLLEMLNVDED